MTSGKALTNDTRHIHDLGRHIYTNSPTQLKNKVRLGMCRVFFFLAA